MGKSKKSNKKSEKKHKQKRKEKKKAKKLTHKSKHPKKEKCEGKCSTSSSAAADEVDDFNIPVELMNSRSHAPETPEEYQKRQSQIRRETDPVTGRTRLIKGDSEVLEEIVSKERHAEINKAATMGDGRFFQENSIGMLQSRKRKK